MLSAGDQRLQNGLQLAHLRTRFRHPVYSLVFLQHLRNGQSPLKNGLLVAGPVFKRIKIAGMGSSI